MKNAYKLICIDVDGTLYNDQKIIPEENKKAIQEADQRGILIAITTGRMYHYGHLYGGMLGADTITIASNGAFVKYQDEVLNHQKVSHEDMVYIKDKIEKYHFFAHYNTWNALVCKGDLGDGNGYVAANQKLPAQMKIDIVVTEDLEKEFLLRKDQFLKAIILSKGRHEDLMKLREELKDHPRLSMAFSSRDNLEVFHKDVGKERGIDALIKKLGITKEEVMAIGDAENDLSMITYAGLGVAMGNASSEVKEAADYITDTNNEAGVGKAIRKFCL
ncbi:MAG TPA: Cof-type HAD-IIB family hydrolase [Proteiniclasticum sp.]|nr:Cof-type HAD-IIB family hydrolase [Proteiniclasticum sp.]